MNTVTAPVLADYQADPAALVQRYLSVRRTTEALAAPLSAEDCAVQSMPDASPTKWHLAHTSWYFETFILEREVSDYQLFDDNYRILFNSYYNSIGEQHPRPQRGLLSRPTLADVKAYRRAIDQRIVLAIEQVGEPSRAFIDVLALGLHHEQQHQELLLMDIKHLLSCNPLNPAYHNANPNPAPVAPPLHWFEYEQGERLAGNDGEQNFAFDNEGPRHPQIGPAFALASRLVTNGEFLDFVKAGSYQNPELWLSDGWSTLRTEQWTHPRYWLKRDNCWFEKTLSGLTPLDLHAPACHISYYEADAYATWAGARLPTEFEWEHVAARLPIAGNFMDSGLLHPTTPAVTDTSQPMQMFGDVWEWTRSAYAPYPGYKPQAGAFGEYNGKFMANQMVLRGGACVTPHSHIRASYRNFYYPHTHWHFSGLRLAKDL